MLSPNRLRAHTPRLIMKDQQALGLGLTWTPKLCIMTLMAGIMGLGPLFYILLVFG